MSEEVRAIASVTVLMSTFNAERFLREALQSVLAQTYADFELLIVDGCSTDRTRDILERFAALDQRVRLVLTDVCGKSEKLNLGLQEASHGWIARLDADDLMVPCRLERQIAFMEANPHIVFAGSEYDAIDPDGRRLRTSWTGPHSVSELENMTARGEPISVNHPTAFYCKRTVLEAGGYDPRAEPLEDKELFNRLILQGKKGLIQPESLLAYRFHAGAITAQRAFDVVRMPIVGETRPWQVVFFAVGLPGLLVALLVHLTIKDPPRRGLKRAADGSVEEVTFAAVLAFMKEHWRTFLLHFGGFSFSAMIFFALLAWAPAYYMRVFELSPTEVGNWLGVILLFVSTSGVFASGWLTDYFVGKGQKDGAIKTVVIASWAIAIPVLLFPQVGSFGLSIALATVTFFFSPFPMVTAAAALQVLSPNQMRAQLSALFLLVTNLLGMGVGTTIVALVTDYGFGSDLAVGHSLGWVCFGSAILAGLTLQACRGAFLKSLAAVADDGEA